MPYRVSTCRLPVAVPDPAESDSSGGPVFRTFFLRVIRGFPVVARGGRLAALFALCCLVALALYGTGLPGSFLFDDAPAFSDNPLASITPGVFDHWRTAALSSNAGPLGRPVAMLSLAAHHAFSGEFLPGQVKFVNMLVHVATAAALFVWLSIMLPARRGFWPTGLDPRHAALIAAVIWVLHPLHVSTVLYAVQRMAQLSALFMFVGLAVFCHYRVRWAARGAERQEVAAAALWLGLLLTGAVLSKENGLLLLWLLPLVEVTVFRGVWHERPLPSLLFFSRVSLFLPLLAIIALPLAAPELLSAGYAQRDFSLVERLLTQSRVLWQYVGWTLWPAPHLMGFQHDDIVISRGLLQPWTTAVALLGWSLLLLLAFRFRRTWPVLVFCVLFYLIGHSMESSVIALEMVYEHRNYLPSAAICLLLAMLLQRCVAGRSKALRRMVLVVAVGLFAVPLFFRASEWSQDFSLARTNVLRHPDSLRSQYFYGNALLRQYRLRDSLALDDTSAMAFVVLGRESFLNMLAIEPDNIPALVMLHYLDSRFFVDLAREERWSERVIAALDGRPLESSDWNALNVLAECLGEATCLSFATADMDALLARLRAHYDRRSDFLAYEFVYQRAAQVEPEIMLATLQDLLSRQPGALKFYPRLVEQYAARDDLGGIYRTLVEWMRRDTDRRYISQQQSVFGS